MLYYCLAEGQWASKKSLFPATEEQTWDLTELQSSKDYLNAQLKGGYYAVRVLVG